MKNCSCLFYWSRDGIPRLEEPSSITKNDVLKIASAHISTFLSHDGTVHTIKTVDAMRLSSILKEDLKSHFVGIDAYTFPDINYIDLCPDARRSLVTQNAGGRSALSEMLSIHYFNTFHNAKDIILEKEVEYWIDYKMVDFVCSIGNTRVGVSVSRAMGYPVPEKFTMDTARHLLTKKLYGLIVSRNGVTEKHSFFKSVLHIWCQTYEIANMLQQAYSAFDINDYGLDIKGSVCLILTVCTGEAIYSRDKHSIVIH
jgi:hypothetical protein